MGHYQCSIECSSLDPQRVSAPDLGATRGYWRAARWHRQEREEREAAGEAVGHGPTWVVVVVVAGSHNVEVLAGAVVVAGDTAAEGAAVVKTVAGSTHSRRMEGDRNQHWNMEQRCGASMEPVGGKESSSGQKQGRQRHIGVAAGYAGAGPAGVVAGNRRKEGHRSSPTLTWRQRGRVG